MIEAAGSVGGYCWPDEAASHVAFSTMFTDTKIRSKEDVEKLKNIQ
jgi:hypothetical protein